ncbi:hypothetical protein IEQ34_010887 [Dendrobium chrysotoxum]|uniref:Uncharacterized protein n=1 Tax=Dendrobium chrysotoxum TaxID=161865 RepID=A0AAV7GWQ7_DENCH|nr:hypothetical protein IEQ34_010887 [Dendrobium chrysotoxum]
MNDQLRLKNGLLHIEKILDSTSYPNERKTINYWWKEIEGWKLISKSQKRRDQYKRKSVEEESQSNLMEGSNEKKHKFSFSGVSGATISKDFKVRGKALKREKRSSESLIYRPTVCSRLAYASLPGRVVTAAMAVALSELIVGFGEKDGQNHVDCEFHKYSNSEHFLNFINMSSAEPPPEALHFTGPPPEALLFTGPPPEALHFAGPPPEALHFIGPPPEALLFAGPPLEALHFAGPPPEALHFAGPPPEALLFAGPPPEALLFTGRCLRPCTSPDHHLRPCSSPDHHLRPCSSPNHHLRPCTSPDTHLRPCSSPDHHLRPCSSPDHHLRPCSSLDHHLRPCTLPDHHLRPCSSPGHRLTLEFCRITI